MNSFYYMGVTYYYQLDSMGFMMVVEADGIPCYDDEVISMAHAEYVKEAA